MVGADPQIIVWGDFNAPAEQCMELVDKIDGLFLLDSPSHTHLKNSTPSFIDHIFANGKLELDINFHDPLESKPDTLSINGDKLGHQTMEIFIPDVEHISLTYQCSHFDYKIFDRFLKNKIPIVCKLWQNDKTSLEIKARNTLDIIQTGIENATSVKTKTTKNFTENKDYFITNQLFNDENQNGKPPTSKFYSFAKKIMKCGFYESKSSRREDEEYAKFLQEKIKSVPPAPRDPKKDIQIDETIQLDTHLKVDVHLIKRFMKSFKSSAQDKFLISGKIMKHLADNTVYVEIITKMMNEILKNGFIPACIRQDHIFGLYKGKGKLSEPSSYRPISISCWTLKIVEKTLVHFLSKHDYLASNTDYGMHAYRTGYNCSTALLNLDQLLCRLNRKLNGKSKTSNLDCKVVIFIDYRGAFEAVSTNTVIQSISHPILKKLVRHCLIRTVVVGTTKMIYLASKSLPQGSCLSPWAYNRADSQVIKYAKQLWKDAGIEADIVGYSDDHAIVTTVEHAKNAVNLMVRAIDKFGFCFEPKKTEILMCKEAIDANPSFKLRLKDNSTGILHTFNPKSRIKWLGLVVQMNHDGLSIIFENQLKNIINMFKAAVMTCSPANKQSIYDIYLSPIFRMYSIFEDVSKYEEKITNFIGPVLNTKSAINVMRNFIFKILKLNNKTTKNEVLTRIEDCENDDWITLETRILRRIANSM